MKLIKLTILILLTLFNTNILLSQSLKSSDLNNFKIEISDTYTCQDLCFKIVKLNNSLDELNDNSKESNSRQNPILRLLLLNLNSEFKPKPSVYQGYVLSNDTLKLIQLLKQNFLKPEGFTYEFIQQKDSIYGLIIHKTNENKLELNISDIEYIKIKKYNIESFDKNEHFIPSDSMVLLKIKDSAIRKIKSLNKSGELYVKVNMCNNNFVISTTYERIATEIILYRNIQNTFLEKMRFEFESLIK